MSLAERAPPLRRKISSGDIGALTVGEWQTIVEALDMVSGDSPAARAADMSALTRRITKDPTP